MAMSQDLDLDIFNDADETTQDFNAEAPSEELEVSPEETTPEEAVEEAAPEEVAPEVPAEEVADVPTEPVEEDDVDVDALIAEILGDTSDIDDKVEDIRDEATASGNEELLGMIDELQTLLAEKNQKIEELTKKDEIVSGRLMDTYGDAENYSFYKPTIEKLENNPQLMMLVKNFDSTNERAQERVVSILADLISEKTGEDISSLINSNQKNSVANALTNVDGGGVMGTPSAPEEDTLYNRDQSLNELF